MIKLYTVNTKKIYSMSMALLIAVTAFFISSIPQTAQAQILTENFEAPSAGTTIMPGMPFGWSWRKISGIAPTGNDFITTSLAAAAPDNALNPTPTTPPSTPQFLMYRGYTPPAGEDAVLTSPAYDFRAGSGTFSFEFYHSQTGVTGDFIQVWYSSVPLFDVNTATPLGSQVNRNNGTTGWTSHSFTIPQQSNCKTYIFIRAVSGAANSGNMYFDNFSITTNPQAMTYSSYAVTQNANPTGLGQKNQDILKIAIVTCGGDAAITLNQLRFNTNGTTQLSDISNAKVWYTKGSNSFAAADTLIQFGATIITPGTNLTFSGSQVLENDINYFWLTYDITGAGTSAGNYVDADWLEFTLSGSTGTVTTNQAPTGARIIAQDYCIPQYGCGTCWPGDFIQDVESYNPNSNPLNAPRIVNNNSGAASSPYYTFYPPGPQKTATIQQGEQYQLRTKVGTYSSGNNIVAWIDFDGNGYFSENERIYEGYYAKSGTPSYMIGNEDRRFTFFVPLLGGGTDPAFWGPRRMRVREIWIRNSGVTPRLSWDATYTWTAPFPNTTTPTTRLHPCNYYAYGETEDYIVTIVPNCDPGEWLGFSTDWDDPANWCDGVPTLTKDVLIPAIPKGGKHPTIKDGTDAECRNIIIEAGATVTVASPKNGNWQIAGTLTNNGTIDVQTSFLNNFRIGNGNLVGATNQAQTPFTRGGTPTTGGGATAGRSQQLYLASELLAKGFTQGDAISTIGFELKNISVNGATATLSNFNIRIGHTSGTGSTWPSGYLTPGAGSLGGTQFAFMTFNGIFSEYSPGNYTPVANTDNLYSLSTPFIWNGSSNILVEVCFRNTNQSTINQYEVNSTQTTGMQNFKAVWFTQTSSFSSPNPAIVGCGGTTTTTSSSYYGTIMDKRANLIVQAYSPNSIYEIFVRGDWINNGSFNAGRSNVIFDGTALQNIDGTNPTIFSRLSVQKTGVVRIAGTAEVDSSLYLGSGVLELNGNVLTLRNSNFGNSSVGTLSDFHNLTTIPAWARNAGFIRAETMPSTGIGYVQWNIGAAPAVRTYQFPFGNGSAGSSTGEYIPVDLDYNSGTNLGNMKVSTYATPPNNLEMPTGVGHINGSIVSPNDPNMIDRYWIMEKSGAATSGAGFKIRWGTGEYAANSVAPYAAQRWWGTGWPFPGIGTNVAPVPPNTIEVTAGQLDAYTAGGAPGGWFTVNNWAAAGFSRPLPIELLSFDAQLKGKEVHLKWTTASEKDNDFFTIEKTRDAYEFDFVAKIRSKYNNSTSAVDYHTIDPDPYRGLSYYRLGQTDFDGTTTYSKLVPVTYNFNTFEIVYTVNKDNKIIVAFGYDYDEPVRFQVTDALGRIHLREDIPEVVTGGNMLTIDGSSLADGIYFITIYNTKESVSKKIFFSKQ